MTSISETAGRLLGGDRRVVCQETIKLAPGKTFNSETDRSNGRKVFVHTKDEAHFKELKK